MTESRDPSHSQSTDPAQQGGRFRAMVEGVADYAIFLLDPQGYIQTWNRGGRNIKGYTAEEIIGEHFSRFYPPDDVTAGKPAWELAEAVAKGSVEDEGWRIRKDGSRFWANVVITALYDDDGNLVGFGKVTRDLTARRSAAEALRLSEERFRLMVSCVKDYGIFMLDPQGYIQTWNTGAERIKGYASDEIIGEHFSRFYPPDDVAAGKPAWELTEAIAKGSVEDEGWRIRKDGSRFWANVVITALYHDDGNLLGFSKITRDLTARRSAEETLRQSEERFRMMVSSVEDYAIFMLDPQGRVQTWNAGAQRFQGYSSEEIIGKDFSCFYPPEDVAAGKPQKELQLAIAHGSVEDEGWRIRKDGSRYWANTVLTGLHDGHGQLLGFSKVTRDMTERRSAEEILRQSEERFRLMVASVMDYAIFMLDQQGRVQTWNAGAQRIKGYTSDEIIGRHFSHFYPPEDVAAGKPAWELAEALAKGSVEDEGWRIRKDGTRFWANVVITALHDEKGQLLGFAKVTRDMTERRQADEALRQSEERFRLMVASVEDYAIFMLDPRGRVETWNLGAQRIKGYTAEEIIGHHFSEFYPPEDVAAGKTEWELREAIAKGRVEDEGWRVRKDGSRFWANVVITALFDDHGQLRGFAKVTRDLTVRKEAEQASIRSQALQEAVRERDEFLSIASHELRTPLTSLQLQIESLHRRFDQDGEKPINTLQPKIEIIERQVERLGRLVSDMLDVAKVETGKLEISREAVDLVALLREILARHDEDFKRAACAVQVDLPETLPGQWDPLRLDQVITNLLTNAMKYGAQKPIDVRLAQQGDEAVLTIADHGIGIADGEQDRIFERFVRLNSARHYGGLGLGLWLSREFIVRMGGTITVTSQPGQGSSFQIRLPLA